MLLTKRPSKPKVYLAAPYSKGDTGINVHSQIVVFSQLLDDNKVFPVPPLITSHLVHLSFPRTWEQWMEYTLDLLDSCDACLRFPASHAGTNYLQISSTGADLEVAYCLANNIPVFYSKDDLYEWVDSRSK